MVVANVDNIVHVIHIHPPPSEILLFTVNIFKEFYIKLELFLDPLILEMLVMAIEILLHHGGLNGEILPVGLRAIPGPFKDQVYCNVHML